MFESGHFKSNEIMEWYIESTSAEVIRHEYLTWHESWLSIMIYEHTHDLTDHKTTN